MIFIMFILFFITFSFAHVHVILPDTQKYVGYYPDIWYNQINWICYYKEYLDIDFVTHVGDIVDVGNSINMWETAYSAFSRLATYDIKYGIAPGNHDYYFKSNDTLEFYKQYFGNLISNNYTFFMPGKIQNNYQIINRDGDEFIIINLEYEPPLDVLEWANITLQENSDKIAIINSHAILDDCGNRIVPIFENLIYDNCNIKLTVNGHYALCSGEGMKVISNKCGEPVFVLMQDYQAREKGGNGYLRYLHFEKNDEWKICVYTYSTYLDQYELDANSYFSFILGKNETFQGCPISMDYTSSDSLLLSPNILSVILFLLLINYF